MSLRWFGESLARKWMVYHVTGLTVVLLIVGFVQYRDLEGRAEQHVEQSAAAAASVLREWLVEHPTHFNTPDLQPVLTRIAGTVPNVARVTVVDPAGVIIADSDPARARPHGRSEASLDVLLRTGADRTRYTEAGQPFLRLTFPIEGPYDAARRSAGMGALVLDIRLSLAHAEAVRVLAGAMLAFSVLLVAFWAGKHVLVNRPFVQSLARVTAAAARLGAGDLSVRLPATSRDEVGALGTAFNAMAENIQHAHGELVAEVQRRQAVEQELALSRDAALESARLKAEFLANMSHEIRTPMNGIIGMTTLLADSPLTSEQRDFAETIRHSGDALLTIINDILDFSKIEAGKLAFEALEFDPRSAVDATLDLLADLAYAKGLELAGLVDPGVPKSVQGDPGRLRQVLINLVGNAVKFTAAGEVFVHVSVEERADALVALRVAVRDTGIGISDQARRRLFQPFTQADGSTTRHYGGTGLGLTISQRLVERMGGTIGVDSALGGGSTFWFTIRLPVTSRVDGPAPAILDDLRILVVSDHAATQNILRTHLNAWGARIDIASEAAAAITRLQDAAASDTPFTVAFVDNGSADLDGLRLLREIKAHPTLAATRLVAMASGHQRDEALSTHSSLCAGRLRKPIKQSQLLDCLTTVLTGNIPATSTSDDASQQVVAGTGQQGTAPNRGRVLIAEDNAVNLKLAVHLLRRLGYHADTAMNGVEAVAAVSRVPYDVVLMDCQMPEMDGYAATAAIRRHEADRHHTTIIAMTANAMAGDREECIRAGMDDYVAKPVKLETLRDVLMKWTAREPRAASDNLSAAS